MASRRSSSLTYLAGGRSTPSITRITPLLALMSTAVTLALLTLTLPPLTVMRTDAPCTVGTLRPFSLTTAAAKTLSLTTWYVRMLTSYALLAGLSKVSTVPAGNLAKAALGGAKTVNGPTLWSVLTRSAALTAATSVEKSELLEATSTIVPGVLWATTPVISRTASPAVAKSFSWVFPPFGSLTVVQHSSPRRVRQSELVRGHVTIVTQNADGERLTLR